MSTNQATPSLQVTISSKQILAISLPIALAILVPQVNFVINNIFLGALSGKALAIGANEAIRVNANPVDGFFVANQLAEVVTSGNYDVVICGKESLDYNGGMVPGMLSALVNYNFVNSCTELTIDGSHVKAAREIDGGKEMISTSLPILVGGQKGIVEEKDLRIPNMRGIMTARTKVLTVLEPVAATAETKVVKFEKPAPKSAVKMISADHLDELISLLHNEAKVI